MYLLQGRHGIIEKSLNLGDVNWKITISHIEIIEYVSRYVEIFERSFRITKEDENEWVNYYKINFEACAQSTSCFNTSSLHPSLAFDEFIQL